MERSREEVERLMTIEKVEALLLALEIIANGDPISVGLDEITTLAKRGLDVFDEEEL